MTKILAYRFSAFGDVAMTVLVFREFLEQNQNVELVMVSRENFRDLFADIPRLSFKGINVDDYKGVFGMRKLAKELVKEFQPNVFADLHDVIRSKTLNLIFKKNKHNVYKIDKGKEEKKELINIYNLDKKQLKTTVERYADVFRKMGFSLNLSQKIRPKSTNKKGIGIAPFAQHKGKMLPLEKSFELAKILSKTNQIYLFGGGKNEIEILNNWGNLLENTTSLAGKLSLKEELHKIAELELMISMDSANMHLASLVGTRCVSIWGSTHIFAGFLGYGQSENDVVQIKDLSCRPCSIFGDKKCFRGDYACLEEINIQMISDKL